MRQEVRSIALFVGLFLLVVLAAWFYSRTVETPPETRGAASAEVSQGPNHPDLEAGLAALRDGEYLKARERFARVPPSDPGYLAALQSAAATHVAVGEFEEALRILEGVRELDPDNPEVLAGIGTTCYRLNRYDEAEYWALRSLEIDPENLGVRYRLALYRVAQGRIPDAIGTYMRAMRLPGGDQQLPTAVENLARLRDDRDDLPGSHYALAFLANAMGNTVSEIEELEAYLEQVSEGPVAENARRQLAEARAN